MRAGHAMPWRETPSPCMSGLHPCSLRVILSTQLTSRYFMQHKSVGTHFPIMTILSQPRLRFSTASRPRRSCCAVGAARRRLPVAAAAQGEGVCRRGVGRSVQPVTASPCIACSCEGVSRTWSACL